MPAPALDVWMLAAEKVYRKVPFNVAAGWVEQGRLAKADKTRPTGTNDPWVEVQHHPLLSDYLPLPAGGTAGAGLPPTTEPLPPPDGALFRRRGEEEDDEVDMIPLIDVSLVLLVFFMMTAVTSSNDAGPNLPKITNGAEYTEGPICVQLDLRETGEAFYAVRVNDKVKPEDNNLQTADDVRARLLVILGSGAFDSPPQVLIACHEKIKHVRVRELAKVLDPLRKDGRITNYPAEVGEEPKK